MATTKPSSSSSSTNLTNINDIKKIFTRFDANGDGKISASELTHVMKALGSTNEHDDINQMMTHLDTDRDGFISLDEFVNFCKANEHDHDHDERDEEELHEAFLLYDLNKNGLISGTELHQILTRLGEKCSVDECVKMIESVDSDGDGCVNFEEFKKMMLKSNGEPESNGESGEGV